MFVAALITNKTATIRTAAIAREITAFLINAAKINDTKDTAATVIA